MRLLIMAVGGLMIAAIAAIMVAVSQFDPDALKPRLAEAVRQATGRELLLNGPVAIKLSLLPTVEVRDLVLSNPPGFSRPAMVTLQQAELRLDLWPLLRGQVSIDTVTLVRPDILLEVNAAGANNWTFAPTELPPPIPVPLAPSAGAPSGTPTAPPPGPGTEAAGRLHVGTVRIRDGRVQYRDATSDRRFDATLTDLMLVSAVPAAPIRLAAQGSVNGISLTLNGEVGSLLRLLDDSAAAPWPLSLNLAAGAATLKIDGTLTGPRAARGYALTVSATIPDAAALAPLLPLDPGAVAPLSGLRGLTLSARVTAQDGTPPSLTAATLGLAGADLTAIAPGLRLDKVEVSAPDPAQPVVLTATGRLDAVPVGVTGTIGHLLLLAEGKPFPLDLRLTAAGATLTARGRVDEPWLQAGVMLDIAAQVPELAALAPLARRPLPALKTIALRGRLSAAPGGALDGLTLSDMRLTLPEGDMAGTVAWSPGPPHRINADLRSDRLDVDALRTALRGMPDTLGPGPAGGGLPGSSQDAPNQSSNAPVATPTPSAGTLASPRPARNGRLLPDTPLPFELLSRAEADLRLQVGTLRLDGADTRNLATHVVLRQGRLRVDPFSADTPEGRVTATLRVDADAAVPPVALTLHAPGLMLRSLLTLAGAPPVATGRLEVYADLHGAGATPRALAASLRGQLGFAMAGGTLDTKLLGAQLGRLSQELQILDLIGRGGATTQIQCLAVRLDAQDGIAQARTLLFASSLLTADGGGSVNLRDETLDLLLRPQGRVAGAGVRVPLRITGPLRNPRTEVDATGAVEANAGKLAGIIIGGGAGALASGLGGLLGADPLSGASGGGACGSALALARAAAATAPAAPPAEVQPQAAQNQPALQRPAPPRPPASSGPKVPNVGGFFRQLLR